MVKVYIHNGVQLIPPYKLDSFVSSDNISVSELIQQVYVKYPIVKNLEFRCFHVFDETNIKFTWNYEKYVQNNNQKLLSPNDKIQDYATLLLVSHHSQHNEDHIIKTIFDTIGTTNKFFVDIGGKDGKEISNVYFLRRNGWKGLCCDADTVPNIDNGTTIIKSFIYPNTVEKILTENNVPEIFDFLSIDIDGDDYYILESLKEHKPRAICIELDGLIYDKDHVNAYGKSDHMQKSSASIIRMTNLCEKMGYKLIYNNGGNGFYVMNEYFSMFKPLTNQDMTKYINDTIDEIETNLNNTFNSDKKLLLKMKNLFKGYKNNNKTKWNYPYIPTVNLFE